ncbi:Laminin subunit alpha-5 [Chelonia mydas]|uniref:Laminin subunit alpha-5 n=1 Tax=Chelonia mydas TaxID=8469 RepID=M7BD46_CHEMY|nr:Laminin subunit alpha-5 [Chelonia mydas]
MNSNKAHPITNAIDGTERWWQSPPLSRGLEFNQVNVTLDLGQCKYLLPFGKATVVEPIVNVITEQPDRNDLLSWSQMESYKPLRMRDVPCLGFLVKDQDPIVLGAVQTQDRKLGPAPSGLRSRTDTVVLAKLLSVG